MSAMASVVEHARALVRYPSVTPDEAGAIEYVETVLSRLGFVCHRLPFSSAGTQPVKNLYARLGDVPPYVCFAGHTDVVPPGDLDLWHHPPFEGHLAGGILTGRGACDMKGGIAAALAAVELHLAESTVVPRGSIGFLITADEEGVAVNGTKKLIEWLIERGEKPDCCILPECTSEAAVADTIKIGRRGSLSAKLTVRGVQGHAAYPQKAKNPLPALLKVLSALTAAPLDNGSDRFQPSNLEITGIDTGNATTNIIPASTSARFNIRFNGGHTGDSLKAWIADGVASALADTGISFEIEYEPVAECFSTEPSGFVTALNHAVEVETDRTAEFSTSGGTSDARFIKDLCPVVEIGLRNATAHKIDENVPIADLEVLTRVFARFLASYIGGARNRP